MSLSLVKKEQTTANQVVPNVSVGGARTVQVSDSDCGEDACPLGAHRPRPLVNADTDLELSFGYALPVSFPLSTNNILPGLQQTGAAIAPRVNNVNNASSANVSGSFPYYVVIVTAENCPACAKFKVNTLPTLLEDLSKKNYGVEHIHLPSTSATMPSQYPRMLETYVVFFPSIILVQGRSWERARVDRNAKIGARVFNTTKSVNGVVPRVKGSSLPTNSSNIKAWISSIVDQDVSLSMQL